MPPIRAESLAIPDRPVPKPVPVDPRVLPLLNHLRCVALKCRAAARADLFEACAMLSANREAARDAHAIALMRCLAPALGRAPVVYRPGTDEISFDEAWLARLALASAADDHDSFLFLLRSRLPRAAQRNVAYLIRTITGQFDLS